MASIIDDLKMQYKLGGITQKLIIWNIACFIVSYVIFGLLQIDFLQYVSLSSNPIDFLWKPWSILTYSFFHSDFFHIFFNLIILNFSGQLFLTFFNQKQLLGLYILSAIFAGVVFIISFYLMNINSLIVGASGAIMAILVATTVYQPLMNLRLMFIGNVKLWHVTLVILLIDVVQLRVENSGGHIAHLAGALFGFIFVYAAGIMAPKYKRIAKRVWKTTGAFSWTLCKTKTRLPRAEMSLSSVARSLPPDALSRPSSKRFLSCSVCSLPTIHVPVLDMPL